MEVKNFENAAILKLFSIFCVWISYDVCACVYMCALTK